MTYYIWLAVNIVFLIISAMYIWLVDTRLSTLITIGKVFSQFAIWFFIINVNMYFIFLVIRKSKQRNIKIALAKMSRKMMKFHIHIAMFGTSLILAHAVVMITQMGQYISYFHPKMIAGYMSLLMLALTLYGGYRRSKKASGFRRKFHLVMAMIFAVVFTIHLFMPF